MGQVEGQCPKCQGRFAIEFDGPNYDGSALAACDHCGAEVAVKKFVRHRERRGYAELKRALSEAATAKKQQKKLERKEAIAAGWRAVERSNAERSRREALAREYHLGITGGEICVAIVAIVAALVGILKVDGVAMAVLGLAFLGLVICALLRDVVNAVHKLRKSVDAAAAKIPEEKD